MREEQLKKSPLEKVLFGKTFLMVAAILLTIIAIVAAVVSWRFVFASVAALIISLVSVVMCIYLLSKELVGKGMPIAVLFGNKAVWVMVSAMFVSKVCIYFINYLNL